MKYGRQALFCIFFKNIDMADEMQPLSTVLTRGMQVEEAGAESGVRSVMHDYPG
jgi:hypothetical protein